jgi:hypothetical protein
MRTDYKTRLEYESVTWLKSFSAATGRPQTDIVNEALDQYRASLLPLPDAQDDRAAFTPPVPPKEAREAPSEPQGGSAGFFDPLSLSGIGRPETLDEEIARLTFERDNVHKVAGLSVDQQREEFERLDTEVRRLQALKISAELENDS